MPASPRDTSCSPGKRRRELPHRTRARKRHKRLDAICDEPTASYLADRKLSDDDVTILRRSSRVRHAPDLLDSSPVPSTRMNNLNVLDTRIDGGGGKNGKWKGQEKEAGCSNGLEKGEPVNQMDCLLGEEGEWKSRLRARVRNNMRKSSSSSRKSDGSLREPRPLSPVMGKASIGALTSSFGSSLRRKEISTHDVSEAATETRNKDESSPLADKNHNDVLPAEKSSQLDIARVTTDDQFDSLQVKLLESLEKVVEEPEFVNVSIQDGGIHHTVADESTFFPHSKKLDKYGSEDHGSNQSSKHPDSPDTNTVERKGFMMDNIQGTEHSLNDNHQRIPVYVEKIAGFRIKEGRRCGLCGCGSDGNPPKKLVHESFDSENEAYEGSTASEEQNCNIWDGFGGEPGWLGRLLGPMHDRFGIARVWVHQHCAVWSPEVYFANLGCLKNVRAALCRGRALKCSRCGRPGATIGCRVDRCPKTYHLPCSRIEGCIFDHRKFLIACSDHRHFFQPHGNNHALQIRKMKAKKMRLDLRKVANEASRKDLEVEEKWLENCGEDEEFLKREGRRLHRDILRIAPIYIGGSSENKNHYQGWESVAGLEHVIQCMKEVVLLPLLYPEFFSNLGLTPPRGILLHGYPGTGKTHVVRALIGACSRGDRKIAYFARKGADCLGKYVGDAERQLRLLFQVAERSQPSIIFFDEIDGLAPRRSRQQDQTHSSVVSTLLSLLDGLKSRGSVIVIGATNRPDAVDPALRRPGRFDREIYFSLPSEKDRSSILSLHTQSWPKPLSGSLLSWIANKTVGFAGADLQALCAQAAIHALKRNCALQQLLSSAAKGTIQGKLPCLPSFKVEERDWLAALTLAPPPCSQREAGVAVNDIVVSPLPVHLSRCFLLPLSHLLVSLYIDERIWLSPMLFKAAKSVKKVIISDLQQKGLPVAFWWSHLQYLIREPFIAEKIECKFAHCGLIVGSSGSSYPIIYDGVDDESDENEKVDSFGIKPSGAYMHKRLMQNCPLQVGKAIGFRALISGAPRSGQQHLASCLLLGFMGHEDIRKVSLATISQEGYGDMVYGLTQILLKCLDVGRCIIYMPRIDLWALEENVGVDASERRISAEKSQSMTETVSTGRKGVSEMWNSFVEQVDSAVTSASLTILATCELEKGDLPHELMCFFSRDSHADSTPIECTIPRFFINIDGKLDLELVINSAAEQLSYGLVQHYLKLAHERSHARLSGDMNKVPHVDINSETNKQNFHHAVFTPQEQVQDTTARKTIVSSNLSELEQIASNGGSSCINGLKIQGTNISPLSHTRGDRIAPAKPYGVQDSFLRTGKVPKGNLGLAIATFGYQILRYPQFAELVWVTSKLREGPYTDISGPWKGWPFNTCVMYTEGPPEKRISAVNSCDVNDTLSPGVVRGLIAVGFLAYRGFYTSVSEVSADVRKVLELLVGQIRTKSFGRKDRYCNFRVLSQVAYLDDMVNSWVYMLQSLQADNNLAEVNSKPVVFGMLQSDNANTSGIDIADNQSNIQAHVKSCNMAPDIPTPVTVDNDGDSAAAITSYVQHTRRPTIDSKELTNGDKPSGIECSPSDQRLNNADQIPGFIVSENTRLFDVNKCNHDGQALVTKSFERGTCDKSAVLDTDLCSNHMGHIPNEQLGDATSFTLQENNDLSKVSCLYNCCSSCIHMMNVMARKMISSYLKSGGCYSLDDVHDIITSCSLNILASFKRLCISESSSDLEESYQWKLHCRAHLEDDYDDTFKGKPCRCKSFEKMQLLPVECDCHTRVDDAASTDAGGGSPSESGLTYCFRDGVLVPLVPAKDSEFHCNFEKTCLCSVVMVLLTIKQTLG